MTIVAVESRQSVLKEKNFASYKNKVEQVIDAIIPQFDGMMKSYTVFNMFFFSIGILEFILLVVFFTFLAQSAVLATSLALVFLTFFSYFILKLYLQAKQPEQYQEIKERFVKACKNLIQYQEGNQEHYAFLAEACSRFSERLQNKQKTFYSFPSYLETFTPLLQRFSAWCHADDVHRMQEILLLTAVDENIKLVKRAPTDLTSHAGLANAYMNLSAIYVYSETSEDKEEVFITSNSVSEAFEKKFQAAAKRAIAELKIMIDFDSENGWAQEQLASIYRDLKRPEEELRALEEVVRLFPDNCDSLCRLGKLYFQQGMNGNGLRVYEQLKQKQDRRADELIKFYGITDL